MSTEPPSPRPGWTWLAAILCAGAAAPYVVTTAAEWRHTEFGLAAFNMMMPIVAAMATYIRLRTPPSGSTARRRGWPRPPIAAAGVIAALCLGVTGAVLEEPLLGSTATWLAAATFAAVVAGANVGRLALLPLFPLVFTAPLTRNAAAGIEESMQYVSAFFGELWLRVLGTTVERDGLWLYTEGFRNFVDETCSGISTVSTLLIYTILLGVLLRMPTRPTTIVAVLTVPLSLLLNGGRVASVSLLGNAGGRELAMGVMHDVTGFAAFFIGYAGLFLTLLWLGRREKRRVAAMTSAANKASGPSQ